jgi:hypothetical protein
VIESLQSFGECDDLLQLVVAHFEFKGLEVDA